MITEKLILENIGNYIRFGGHGILDGLKLRKTKVTFLKIVGLRRPDPTAGDQAVMLKQYRKRYQRMLPRYYWDQEFEIIKPKEYKMLPAY